MLKISSPRARFVSGAVLVSTNKYIYHVLHSKTLCMTLDHPGDSIPISVVFAKIDKLATSSCSLHAKNNPGISLIRILLSSHPYIQSSSLSVGHQQANNIIILYQQPVVLTQDYGANPIKINSTVMVSNDYTSLDGAVPLADDLTFGEMVYASRVKSVSINENLNIHKEFDPDITLESSMINVAEAGKPIIKKSVFYNTDKKTSKLHAQIYYAARHHAPEIGKCPVGPFNTILIMCKSHNTLQIVPSFKLNHIQRLFVKHVILFRMGLENCVEDFVQVFTNLQNLQDSEVECFEHLVGVAKAQVEDIVFALNSISMHVFQKPVTNKKDHWAIKLALDKYFLMFPPKDKLNAINFGAGIIDIICSGITFEKLVKFLSKYLEIQETAKETNLLKMFALLST